MINPNRIYIGRERRKFGRRKKKHPIEDRRPISPDIRFDPPIGELFSGETAVLSPHPDDASLSCGLGILRKGDTTGISIYNLFPGSRSLIPGFGPEQVTEKRKEEAIVEGNILKVPAHFMNLKDTYDNRRFSAKDSKRFFHILDVADPNTIVIPTQNDAHLIHRLARYAGFDWAAERAWESRPVVIVEGGSLWGSVPELHVTHSLEYTNEESNTVRRAQRAHESQWTRVDHPTATKKRAEVMGIVLGERKAGFGAARDVETSTRPQEVYSQHLLHRIGRGENRRLVLDTLTPKLRARYNIPS